MTTDLSLVESPTGPIVPPKPKTRIDTIASSVVLAGALTGLGFTANAAPELVFYPIGASLAATVIAAVVLVRTPPGGDR